MSDWLTRAKSLLGVPSQQEAVPEPLEIVCPCGRCFEALRRESFQRVLCKKCGEAFFLLPLDVYPRPVMKVKVVPGPRRQTAQDSVKPAEKKGKSATAATTMTEPPARPSVNLTAVLGSVRQRIVRQFTALRLIVLALLAVIGLTGWWQWNRTARSNSEVTFQKAWEAGQAAVAKQDWPAAFVEFEQAAHAVDVLKRTDSQAVEVRQRHRELAAVNSLLTSSMAEVFDDLKVRRQKESTAAAESAFPGLYAGRWIVLQCEMTPDAKPSESPVTWELPMLFESEGLLLVGQFPAFAKVPALPVIEGQSAESREVIFAAKLESVRWDATQSLWVMSLSGASGFLWSHFDSLLAAGLAPDELRSEVQIKSLLAEQSRWIGVSP